MSETYSLEGLRRGVGLLLVFALLSACATSTDNSNDQRDAASDTSNPPPDATARDAECEETMLHICAWTPCTQSVSAACAQRPGFCDITNWPTDPTAFCHLNPGLSSDYVAVGDTCTNYHLLVANGVDGGDDFYYSASTGKLVAIVAHDYNRNSALCLGGPSNFVEPKCDFATVDCTDAGGGTAGAGGGTGGGGGTDSGSTGGAAP